MPLYDTPAEIDEPRRIGPDHAWLPIDDEPELSQWANEMGLIFEPGHWPTTDGGI